MLSIILLLTSQESPSAQLIICSSSVTTQSIIKKYQQYKWNSSSVAKLIHSILRDNYFHGWNSVGNARGAK